MKKIISLLSLLTILLYSCNKDDNNDSETVDIQILSTTPKDGETGVADGTKQAVITFNQAINYSATNGSVTVNGQKATFSKSGTDKLVIEGFTVEQGGVYKIVVDKGTIVGYDKDFTFSFSGTLDNTAPTVESKPNDGSIISLRSNITIVYSETVNIADANSITVNGNKVSATVEDKTLTISFDKEAEKEYSVKIAAGAITDLAGNTAPEVAFVIKTSSDKISKTAINSSNTAVQKVYKFLYDNYGKKIISGSMSNVSVNQNEAALIKSATGKTPVMQTFDFCFVTLTSDRSTWEQNSIYQDITYYKNLWQQGGIVSACWHLNVPRNESDAEKNQVNDNTKSWSTGTNFSAKNAIIDGTWENDFIKFSFDKAIEVLKKYKEAGIPVVWRPFHEASGNVTITGSNDAAWFWWGKDGAEAYKALWIYMFNYFKNHEVDNLIWVWTTQIGVGSDSNPNWYCKDDSDWYPGDEYVDIIAHDNYNKAQASKSVETFNIIEGFFPNKMITLGENGSIANISEIFAAGGKFSYFMPWYTYELTKLDNSEHANTAWWNDAANCENVLFLEDMTAW